jgi:hypothetical protein
MIERRWERFSRADLSRSTTTSLLLLDASGTKETKLGRDSARISENYFAWKKVCGILGVKKVG